mmetsp:Transcript_7357/g.21574  ORF Transcript_7357/g.21574 Transcript_7357/m.21574 type:complete len:110 (+) Transcript_7357:258-587(+)
MSRQAGPESVSSGREQRLLRQRLRAALTHDAAGAEIMHRNFPGRQLFDAGTMVTTHVAARCGAALTGLSFVRRRECPHVAGAITAFMAVIPRAFEVLRLRLLLLLVARR